MARIFFGSEKTKQVKKPLQERKGVIVNAAYDAAQTNEHNARHWAWADSFSADASMRGDVRRRIRNRARYEYANNSYAYGLAQTVAGDLIGTGPSLCVQSSDASIRQRVETAWKDWSLEVGLAEKLRTMRLAKMVDGEAFALMVHRVLKCGVEFDVIPFESDRVTSDQFDVDKKRYVDGITLDDFGYPVSYRVLDQHPGDFAGTYGQYTVYPAEVILHWFRQDRPEQHRGISELTQALPLFAQLRRYTLAVLTSAETAADFSIVMYTDSPAVEPEVFDGMDSFTLERNMMTALPAGWKSGQIDPKQPTNTYPDFKRELLSEIGRIEGVPINIMSGDSSHHNYASGRLDHQQYYRKIRIEQAQCAEKILNPIFNRWYKEFRLIDAAIVGAKRRKMLPESIPYDWIFDGFEHVDPSKEASAQEKRLANHTTTLAFEFAKLGKDWEEELRQMAKEKKLMEELGLTVNDVNNKTKENKGNENDGNDEDDSV